MPTCSSNPSSERSGDALRRWTGEHGTKETRLPGVLVPLPAIVNLDTPETCVPAKSIDSVCVPRAPGPWHRDSGVGVPPGSANSSGTNPAPRAPNADPGSLVDFNGARWSCDPRAGGLCWQRPGCSAWHCPCSRRADAWENSGAHAGSPSLGSALAAPAPLGESRTRPRLIQPAGQMQKSK